MKLGNRTAATNSLATTLSILLLASGLGTGVALGQSVVINEFMADNEKTLTNKLGMTSDWIELYNGGGSTVNLAGWYLTDADTKVDKCKFPSTNLAAGKYLLVYASGSNGVYFGELHTSFKLSKKAGKYLALANSNKVVVSSYTNYPEQEADMSYGIATNVLGGVGYFARASPGAANSNGFVAFVADTKFSVNRGLFTTNITVSVTSATAQAQIRYTTDCSDPTTNSTLYSAPRAITNSTVLRANAFKSGWVSSGIDTHSYIMLADVLRQPTNPPGWPALWTVRGAQGPTNVMADYQMDPGIVSGAEAAVRLALANLPTLFLVTPQTNLFDPATGLYANPMQSGAFWERPVSAEWIDPDNKSKFQIDGGLRIQGGITRGNPLPRKRSFTLRFKDIYGEKELNADLFSGDAVDSFRNLVLRDGADDSWKGSGNANGSYIKDEFARRMQLAMGHVSPHGRFIHLYLNGLYWGVYNVTERIDKHFAASYYGGDADDWDVMSSFEGVLDGNSIAWQAMKTVLTDNTLSPDAKFQKVQGNNPDGTRNPAYPVYLDMNNYIDYLIVGLWMGTADWGANWRACRYRDDAESTGFKFPNWDSTDSMDVVDAWGNPLDGGGGFSVPHVNLTNSVEYRLRFADRVQKHFFNGGALTPTNLVARWQGLKAEVGQALVAESARWGDMPDSGTPGFIANVGHWSNYVNYTESSYVAQRSAYLLEGSNVKWNLKNRGLYPTNVVSPSFSPAVSMFTNSLTLAISSTSPVYYTLDGSDPRQCGTGAIIGAPYSSPLVLTYTTIVKARARSAGGEWSALSEMVFTAAATPSLRVSELMYHPREPEVGQAWKSEGDEFIELYNAGATPICMVGMKLTKGVQFDFASGDVPVLSPGGYLLVVRNRAAFTNRYPSVAVNKIAGQFDLRANSLDNGGEKVELEDAVGRNVITFTYNDAWLLQTDGAGHSLIPISGVTQADGELSYPGNWKASVYIGGSPGTNEPAALRRSY